MHIASSSAESYISVSSPIPQPLMGFAISLEYIMYLLNITQLAQLYVNDLSKIRDLLDNIETVVFDGSLNLQAMGLKREYIDTKSSLYGPFWSLVILALLTRCPAQELWVHLPVFAQRLVDQAHLPTDEVDLAIVKMEMVEEAIRTRKAIDLANVPALQNVNSLAEVDALGRPLVYAYEDYNGEYHPELECYAPAPIYADTFASFIGAHSNGCDTAGSFSVDASSSLSSSPASSPGPSTPVDSLFNVVDPNTCNPLALNFHIYNTVPSGFDFDFDFASLNTCTPVGYWGNLDNASAGCDTLVSDNNIEYDFAC
jgi:hypothetical protein